VLAQAVPGAGADLSGLVLDDGPHGGRMGQDGGLCVVGAGELLFGPLPHDPRERDTERVVDGGERVARGREPLGQIVAHADALGALARAHEHAHHRITALPQVKPAPNATIRTTDPGPTRPSATACSSASGIEAEDVLPKRSTLTITLDIGNPACLAMASMIRRLAWC